MPSDERSFKRFNLFIVVEFRPLDGRAEPFWGITRNFSDEGFSFESQEFSIENGGLLECIFKKPESDLTVSIPGKIVWKEEADKFQCLTGIKFQDLNEERKDKLLAIMSAAGELPSDFFPDTGKTKVAAAIPENHLRSQEKMEIFPEEPVSENGSVYLEETVKQAKKSASEKKAVESERKIPFLVPVTAFIIGAALFIVIKKYDEGIKDMFSYFRQPPSVERVEGRLPESVDETPRDDTIVSTEQSAENKIPLPGPEETSGMDRTDEGTASLFENKTKPPILIAEELISDKKEVLKSADSDRLTTAPEKESVLVREGLINNILEARKSVEINKKQTEEKKVPEQVVIEKPVSIIKPQDEASGEKQDESEQMTVISDEADNEQPETPNGDVKKEPGNIAEHRDVITEQKEEDITPLIVYERSVPDPPAAETESITVAALPESKIESIEGAEVPAEAPAEAADNQISRNIPILKEKLESYSVALILTSRKKEEKIVKEEEIVKEEKIVEFEEPFNDNANKWDLFNTMVASAQIKDGEYQIENKRKRGLHFVFNEYGFPHDSDFTIEVDIKKEKGSKGAYGFALGASDAFNNHVILIDGNKFNLIRNRNGVPRKLTSVAIGKGIIKTRSFNRLKIEKNGDSIRLYINDYFIHEVLNISFDGDKIGFVVGGGSKISVEKMRSQIISYD